MEEGVPSPSACCKDSMRLRFVRYPIFSQMHRWPGGLLPESFAKVQHRMYSAPLQRCTGLDKVGVTWQLQSTRQES